MSTPKFAHNVFQTANHEAMRDWYCTVLDAHVVYEDATWASRTVQYQSRIASWLAVWKTLWANVGLDISSSSDASVRPGVLWVTP